jgi:hypothetical protein
VAQILESPEEKKAAGLFHERAGELIVLSRKDRWFSYYFWDQAHEEPDYARTVDIHRKPGYDPVELFFDPEISFLKLKMMGLLLKKNLGFRTLMKVIPLNAGLVRGSHGLLPDTEKEAPLLISSEKIPNSCQSFLDLRPFFLDLMFPPSPSV